MKVLTAIPVYNEERHLDSVLTEVQRYCSQILVVNDGSDRSHRRAFACRKDVACHYGIPKPAATSRGLDRRLRLCGFTKTSTC